MNVSDGRRTLKAATDGSSRIPGDRTTPARSSGAPAPSVRYLYLLAFCSGMGIMAVELCASRLVAPYFGTSTFVWTNVIGVIMIALSAGYITGGRLADRRPELSVLLKLLLAACLFLLLLPVAAPPLLRGLAGGMRSLHSAFSFIFYGSLVAIGLLFAPPIVILGMTSPFLIRLSAQQRRVGDSAGRIFALSTIGSVLGTFLPVLVFIPAFGTARTIVIFAAALLLVVAFGFLPRRAALASLGVVLPLFLPLPALHRTPGLVCSAESAYQYIEVFDRGDLRYLTYNDALGYQTVASKSSPFTGIYYDYYSLLPFYLKDPASRVLILGLGGGIIANQYHYFHPQVAVDGVEIDPRVIGIARQYFSLTDQTAVYNQDARVFLRQSDARYDIAIVDAYTQQVYIPFHLTTREFFAQVRSHLDPEGIVAMNVSAARDDAPLVAGLTATLGQVFRHVYSFRIPESVDNVVLASDRSLDFAVPPAVENTPFQPMAEQCANLMHERSAGTARAFTDDWAPVEHMVDWEMMGQRRF